MPVPTLLPFALAILAIQGTDGVAFRQPQLARDGARVYLTMGAGNGVYFAGSNDGGATFAKPVRVAEAGKLMLGRHRGPRIAASNGAIVVSANVDGDLLSWRSTDQGATWSQAVRVNSVPQSAREGLHAMAAGAGMVAAVWLDMRKEGMRLYGAVSKDGGASWSENRLVYESPDGHICECCHPSVKIGAKGEIVAMWRNWLSGNRDMYLARSTDGGKSFAQVAKAGSGSWPLNACPMDGGDVALTASGDSWTAFRRDTSIVLAGPDGKEKVLGSGKDPAMALGGKGAAVAWTERGIRLMQPPYAEPVLLDPAGSFAHMIGGPDIVVAWETASGIKVTRIAE